MTEIKDHPILFSGPMVRANQRGDKTKTRRVIKPQPEPFDARDKPNDEFWWFRDMSGLGRRLAIGRILRSELEGLLLPHCPYGAPGEYLWVRETWAAERRYDHLRPSDIPRDSKIFYTADGIDDPAAGKLRPSIHMPRHFSRTLLEIVSVRVERVQEISDADAEAEGCRAEQRDNNGNCWQTSARDVFCRLWNSINAKRGYGWDVNPFVWSIEYKVIK